MVKSASSPPEERIVVKLGNSFHTIILPTLEEDEAINRAIAEDPDTFDVSDLPMEGWMPYAQAPRSAAG